MPGLIGHPIPSVIPDLIGHLILTNVMPDLTG